MSAIDATTGRLAIGGVELGNTGARNIAADCTIVPGVDSYPAARLTRSGNIVTMYLDITTKETTLPPSPLTPYTLPIGFRPVGEQYAALQEYSTNLPTIVFYSGEVNLYGITLSYASTGLRLQGTWHTSDAWPTTLPGTPVAATAPEDEA